MSDTPKIIKVEEEIKEEIIRIIESGDTDILNPNSDKAVFVCGHLICVRYISYPGSQFRIWEWDGDIDLYNEDTKSSTHEYIYGNFDQKRVTQTEMTGSSQTFKLDGQPLVKEEDDRIVKRTNSDTGVVEENAAEDGREKQRRYEQKIHDAVVKLGLKPWRTNVFGPVVATSDANKHKVDVDVDESGVEVRDIEWLMKRLSVSRSRAVKALKHCNGDAGEAAHRLITYGDL